MTDRPFCTSTGGHVFATSSTYRYLPGLIGSTAGVGYVQGSGTYYPVTVSRCIHCGATE